MVSKFQSFCDALAFLQQDQPQFESQAGRGEFIGTKHEELVMLGSKMLRNLLKLAKKGESYAQALPPGFLDQLIDAILSYYNLFNPPKRFGGYFSCFKMSRHGIEYEKKLAIIKAKVVSAVFLPIGMMVNTKAEILNIESVKYSEYVTRMNDLFKLLNAIVTKGNETIREKARKDLYMAWDSVRKFVEHYCESNENFVLEARRRLRSIREIIHNKPKEESPIIDIDGQSSPSSSSSSFSYTPPPPPPNPNPNHQSKQPPVLGRRMLIKAQSGLQEIMNSAALIGLKQSKSNLYAVDDIQKLLKRERDAEVALFNGLEDEMHDEASIQVLHRLREESEIVYNEANSKLREAAKRWNTVKQQSYPRPVATIEEPLPPNGNSSGYNISNGPSLANTRKEIRNASKIAANEGGKIAKEAVSGVKDMVSFVTGDVVKGVGSGVSGAVNIAASGAKSAINVGGKAVQLPAKAAKDLLGLDESQPSPQHSNRLTNNSNNSTNGSNFPSFDKFPKLPNLLD